MISDNTRRKLNIGRFALTFEADERAEIRDYLADLERENERLKVENADAFATIERLQRGDKR